MSTPGPARPSVLFVCVHNAGRSQMAAVYLEALCGGQVEVRYAGSAVGIPVALGLSVLLAAAFTGLSDALALLLRSQESLIGLSQFLTLPLSFLSSVMIAPSLMPSWVESAARWNPLDWAAVGSREALSATPDWGLVGRDAAQLAVLALVLAVAASAAFRSYQRST